MIFFLKKIRIKTLFSEIILVCLKIFKFFSSKRIKFDVPLSFCSDSKKSAEKISYRLGKSVGPCSVWLVGIRNFLATYDGPSFFIIILPSFSNVNLKFSTLSLSQFVHIYGKKSSGRERKSKIMREAKIVEG